MDKTLFCDEYVSIFAPEGVCQSYSHWKVNTSWFQSSHPDGVRRFEGNTTTVQDCYNPRTRIGCVIKKCVSIVICRGYNPRTRVGCVLMTDTDIGSAESLQSSHPCRVRQYQIRQLLKNIALQSSHPDGVRRPKKIGLSCKERMLQSSHPDGVRQHRPIWLML